MNTFPFSRTLGVGTHQLATTDLNILVDTSEGAVNLILPSIAETMDFIMKQGYSSGAVGLFPMNITDISDNASVNNITITTKDSDKFSGNIPSVVINENSGSYYFKPSATNIWSIINSGTAGGGSQYLPCIDVTWSQLNTLATNSLLIECQQYNITDFRTRENIPNTEDVHLGEIEPIVVIANSVNSISGLARSTVYPNDTLVYELNDSTNQGGDMGRISYRKDELLNIETWYDWRNIVFRRWRKFKGGVFYILITPSSETDVFQDFYTFDAQSLNDLVVYDVSINQSFDESMISVLPNTTFQGVGLEVTGVSFGNGVLDNTFLDSCIGSKFGTYAVGNTITGAWGNNIIGDSFNNNTLADSYNNNIGNSFSDNVILAGFESNTILNNFGLNDIQSNFYDNNIGNNFNNNTIETLFVGNTIQLGFFNNVIGTKFADNNISNYFYSNTVGNNFGSNPFGIPSIDSGNVIGTYCYGNTFGLGCYVNNLGSNFNSNVIPDQFNNNIAADIFEDNVITSITANRNVFGVGFRNNEISSSGVPFSRNTFGIGCINNVIGDGFIENKIGNTFTNNADQLNSPLKGFSNNTIGNNFSNNIIQEGFKHNKYSGEYFSGNTIGLSCTYNNFETDVVGIDFTSSTLIYLFYNKSIILGSNGLYYVTYFDGFVQQYATPITT